MITTLHCIGFILWVIVAVALLLYGVYRFILARSRPSCDSCSRFYECMEELDREGIPRPDCCSEYQSIHGKYPKGGHKDAL